MRHAILRPLLAIPLLILQALLAGPTLAEAEDPGLLCTPVAGVACTAEASCTSGGVGFSEVRLWPEEIRDYWCRSASCPPLPPTLSLCGPMGCASGPIAFERPFGPGKAPPFQQGIARLGFDPPPRLYSGIIVALSWDPESGRLALLRFADGGQTTAWLDCRPPGDEDLR